MAVAGYCRTCAQYVYLDERWGCVNGHPWTEISNWYDPDGGQPITPYWLQPAPEQPVAVAATPAETVVAVTEPVPTLVEEPAPAAPEAVAPPVDARLALLADILAAFAPYPGYAVAYGTDTDVVIGNDVADASWGTGKKKVEYSAILKAMEPERTIHFWEMLKESGGGLNFGGFESESYSTVGMKRFGKKKEVVAGPGGVAMDYDWDYAATRRIVEDVAARHGWRVKVVLRKSSAQW